MKVDRIMWGIVLLFIGGVLLLENFNVIDFYWSSVWRFWPIFLIIAGVNILFNKSKSQLGGVVSISILVITLVLLFFKGQEPRKNRAIVFKEFEHRDFDDQDEDSSFREQHLSLPYGTDSTAKRTVLNISGGGTSFELKGHTDSLISAVSDRGGNTFILKNNFSKDSVATLNLKMRGKGEWNSGGNSMDIRLNRKPDWDIHVNMGAGEIDFDLSDFKVRQFSFDGGAAALDVKLGSLLPIADVNVKTGIADVKINIPSASGCQIRAKTGLSAKEFTGFIKLDDNTYETPNYKTSKNKIFINFDGGLSNFEVKRY
ncbi:LiaF transmembrane domain-containing protein [Pedobacter nyackensis]|uniref:LiaF transmembrane domain-containing protein n=1 Tax=Pedobacter nyackensis TaxID=475255 RepID=A0A1W2D050_9SPHI|nr:DUF5668 domain-containing protein [Pedobacter nyackensis]SMC90929.1 hypothetical protein SAMN04488101_105149 [Pedobacter nyackensis]